MDGEGGLQMWLCLWIYWIRSLQDSVSQDMDLQFHTAQKLHATEHYPDILPLFIKLSWPHMQLYTTPSSTWNWLQQALTTNRYSLITSFSTGSHMQDFYMINSSSNNEIKSRFQNALTNKQIVAVISSTYIYCDGDRVLSHHTTWRWHSH
jgi:hypothetical protein